jgi:hypothetical protein
VINHQDQNGRWKTRLFDVSFKGFTGIIAVTYHLDDRFSEMSWIGPKGNSDLAMLAEDACTLLNELLQRFVSLETVTDLVLRYEDGKAASLIGEIVLQLADSP